MEKVRKGGARAPSAHPMAPVGPDKISDGDLKAVRRADPRPDRCCDECMRLLLPLRLSCVLDSGPRPGRRRAAGGPALMRMVAGLRFFCHGLPERRPRPADARPRWDKPWQIARRHDLPWPPGTDAPWRHAQQQRILDRHWRCSCGSPSPPEQQARGAFWHDLLAPAARSCASAWPGWTVRQRRPRPATSASSSAWSSDGRLPSSTRRAPRAGPRSGPGRSFTRLVVFSRATARWNACVFGRDGALARSTCWRNASPASREQAGNSIRRRDLAGRPLVAAQNYQPGGVKVRRGRSRCRRHPAEYARGGSRAWWPVDLPGSASSSALFDADRSGSPTSPTHARRADQVPGNIGRQPLRRAGDPDGRHSSRACSARRLA